MEITQREESLRPSRPECGRSRSAERARDPERLIADFSSVPEFHFYHDGRRAPYAVMEAGVRKTLPACGLPRSCTARSGVSGECRVPLVSATFRREMSDRRHRSR